MRRQNTRRQPGGALAKFTNTPTPRTRRGSTGSGTGPDPRSNHTNNLNPRGDVRQRVDKRRSVYVPQRKMRTNVELPTFDLTRASEVSDKDFADMLDGNVRFIGNLSKFADSNPDRWPRIRALRRKVGESREEIAERRRREAVMHQTEPALTPAEEIALAEAITAYPRELCKQIFADGVNAEATKLHDENPAEYAKAQLSARHWDIIGKVSGEPSVRFNYETPSDYRAKIPVPVTEPSGPPPGVAPCADGVGYCIVDAKAHSEWKALQEARKVISEASKVQ